MPRPQHHGRQLLQVAQQHAHDFEPSGVDAQGEELGQDEEELRIVRGEAGAEEGEGGVEGLEGQAGALRGGAELG